LVSVKFSHGIPTHGIYMDNMWRIREQNNCYFYSRFSCNDFVQRSNMAVSMNLFLLIFNIYYTDNIYYNKFKKSINYLWIK